MSKSILVIETPKDCEHCDCCVNVIGKKYCTAQGVHLTRDGKGNCKLKPLPEKIEYNKGTATPSYAEGWNDCIDALIGE